MERGKKTERERKKYQSTSYPSYMWYSMW